MNRFVRMNTADRTRIIIQFVHEWIAVLPYITGIRYNYCNQDVHLDEPSAICGILHTNGMKYITVFNV